MLPRGYRQPPERMERWECDTCGEQVRYWDDEGLPRTCPNCEAPIYGCDYCAASTTLAMDDGESYKCEDCQRQNEPRGFDAVQPIRQRPRELSPETVAECARIKRERGE